MSYYQYILMWVLATMMEKPTLRDWETSLFYHIGIQLGMKT